jgi:hypothetical protein
LLLNLGLAVVFTGRLGASGYQAFVLIFFVDYLLIAVYWALRSHEHARRRENRNLGESVADRFWRSSATVVSLNVVIVISSAAGFMLGNAGLRAVGAEFSHFQK